MASWFKEYVLNKWPFLKMSNDAETRLKLQILTLKKSFAENILWKVEEADIEGELVIFKIFIKSFVKGRATISFSF